MDATGLALPPKRLPESQRAALICLLADEDPVVYRTVRDKLVECGPSAREWLRPHLLSSDPLLRRRAHEIVEHFERQTADDRFLAFCLKQGEDLDLEQAAFLLSQTRHPGTNLEAYQALLEEFAGDLRERVAFARGSRGILGTLNHYLFAERGFHGNEEQYYDPDNSYFTKVLDRRVGIPISLCLVYMLIARRLRLPVAGVGLPGHFLCRFQSSSDELYIDCFDGGRIMTKAGCVQEHLSGHYDLRDEYLVPLSPRRVLMRLCGNLHRIYYHFKVTDEITRCQRYLVALAR